MNLRRMQRGQVLVVIVGAIFIGGGLAAGVVTSGDTLKAMKKNIKAMQLEGYREDQALDILKRWNKSVKPMWKDHRKRNDVVLKLLESQHTSAEDIAEQFALQTSEFAVAEALVLSYREELRSLLTREEWERLFPRN